jgi:hypothetical protein
MPKKSELKLFSLRKTEQRTALIPRVNQQTSKRGRTSSLPRAFCIIDIGGLIACLVGSGFCEVGNM